MKRLTDAGNQTQTPGKAYRWLLCLALCLVACAPKTPALVPTTATPTPVPPDTPPARETDTLATTQTHTPTPQVTFASPLHTPALQATFISPLHTQPAPSPTPTAHVTVTVIARTPTPLTTASVVLTPTLSAETAALEQEMWQAVNDKRSAAGLPSYRLDQDLAEVARNHAIDMVARGYWGHVSPEGQTLPDRLAAAGLHPGWAGENYYYGYDSAEDFVELAVTWFMDDPPHRDNLLHEAYTRVGIGIVEGPPGAYTVVLDFVGDK